MSNLVTGGSGFLGSYVVEQLVARGERVRVFCRSEPDCQALPGVEWYQGDIRDVEKLSGVCQDIDTVFHCSARVGIWGPWKIFHAINTQGTLDLLDAARSHGVSRFVYTSSPSVVFDGQDHANADESLPFAPKFLCAYPRSKALAEEAVRSANGQGGLATVTLRPHLLWGPGDNQLLPRMIERAQSKRLRRVGDGHNHISMSYVENAAAAHIQAADLLHLEAAHAGKVYFINETESVNLWEWINRLLSLAGVDPVDRSLSVKTALWLGGLSEAAWWLLRRRGDPPMTRFLALQLARTHSYSIAAAERDFGYRKIVTVEEGLRRTQQDLQRQSDSAHTRG